MLYCVFLAFVDLYEIALQSLVQIYFVQLFLRNKTSVALFLIQQKYIGLCILRLCYNSFVFSLKCIFVGSVFSISVYLCQNQEFFLNYNFLKF